MLLESSFLWMHLFLGLWKGSVSVVLVHCIFEGKGNRHFVLVCRISLSNQSNILTTLICFTNLKSLFFLEVVWILIETLTMKTPAQSKKWCLPMLQTVFSIGVAIVFLDWNVRLYVCCRYISAISSVLNYNLHGKPRQMRKCFEEF